MSFTQATNLDITSFSQKTTAAVLGIKVKQYFSISTEKDHMMTQVYINLQVLLFLFSGQIVCNKMSVSYKKKVNIQQSFL